MAVRNCLGPHVFDVAVLALRLVYPACTANAGSGGRQVPYWLLPYWLLPWPMQDFPCGTRDPTVHPLNLAMTCNMMKYRHQNRPPVPVSPPCIPWANFTTSVMAAEIKVR